MTSPRIATALTAAGALIVVGTSVAGGSWSVFLPVFVVWGLAPYVLLLALGLFVRNPWIVGGAGAAALAVEVGVRLAVFVFPTGSTAAIALVFSPAIILVAAMPCGAGAAWVLGVAHRRGGAGARGLVWAVVAMSLGLVVVAFGRPDLLPTAIISRQQALGDIGDPRVVAGADRFSLHLVEGPLGWYDAADFDGEPGDEIAVVTQASAHLIDPVTLADKGDIPFNPGGGPALRWNWFSRLVRLPGGWAVAATGGGYQETDVRMLDNSLVWQYHPDADLPPSAMQFGDLDGDGEVEFYASSVTKVARLSPDGVEMWTRPTRMAQLVALAPRTADSPSWVVAYEYGRTAHVWDAEGRLLADVAHTGEPLFGVVDWPRERVLLKGESSARGIGLDGAERFAVPLAEHMRLVGAVSVRFVPSSPRLLAIVSTGPRDVKRWRLTLVDEGQRVVYDEVFDHDVRLLVARGADGGETLCVAGDGLRVLRSQGGNR